MDFTIHAANPTETCQYFKLLSLNDPFFSKHSFATTIKELFDLSLKITIESKKEEWTVSWKNDNPFLYFKPIYEPTNKLASVLKNYLINYFAKGPDYDVFFVIENREIKAHSFFLKQSDYFITFLKYHWKGDQPIYLKGYSYLVFKTMIYFFYVGEIKEKHTGNCRLLFDLYGLGVFIDYEPLKDYCKSLLNSLIEENNFLLFAFYQEKFKDEFFFNYANGLF